MFLFEICSRNAAPSFCEAWPASGPAAEFSQRGSFYSAAVRRLILFKLHTPLLRARQEDEFVYWMVDQFVYKAGRSTLILYIWMSEGCTRPSQASVHAGREMTSYTGWEINSYTGWDINLHTMHCRGINSYTVHG